MTTAAIVPIGKQGCAYEYGCNQTPQMQAVRQDMVPPQSRDSKNLPHLQNHVLGYAEEGRQSPVKIPQTLVLLLMGLGVCSPNLNAQAKLISRSQEAQVTCVVDLEPPPMTPYGFAMATLKSLGSARDALNEGTREPDGSADNPLTLVTGTMRGFKLSTNYFICAKRAVQPFTNKAGLSSLTPEQRKGITSAAGAMVSVYDKKIAINDQVLQLFKKLVGNGNGNMAQFSDQVSTLQVESEQTWADLVVPVGMSMVLLIDMRATDENGNFIQASDSNPGYVKRLVVTKAQKQELLDWINKHFPELKDGTPEDKIADPAKSAEMYLKFFDGRMCSDEPATIPAGS